MTPHAFYRPTTGAYARIGVRARLGPRSVVACLLLAPRGPVAVGGFGSIRSPHPHSQICSTFVME